MPHVLVTFHLFQWGRPGTGVDSVESLDGMFA